MFSITNRSSGKKWDTKPTVANPDLSMTTGFEAKGTKTLYCLHQIKQPGSKSTDCLVNPIPIRHDMLKRAFDIFFSISCIALFAPVFLTLGILIRCTTPGPIFYRSKRLGRGGTIIECLKFRTMYADAEIRLTDLIQTDPNLRAEWETYQKFKCDPRITPIGQFLRKTSLDELPQFWNVLKGDLSIVGPRPPTLIGPPEQYLQEIRTVYGESAFNILSVRPGITGVWQTSGRSEIPLIVRRQMEEQYAISRTFWTDLVVIAKTVPAILFSKGAF